MEKTFSKIDFELDKESHKLFFDLLYDTLNHRGIEEPKRLFSITHKTMPSSGHNQITGKWETEYVQSYGVHYTSYCLYDAGGETSHGTRYFYNRDEIWESLDSLYKTIRSNKRDQLIDEILAT